MPASALIQCSGYPFVTRLPTALLIGRWRLRSRAHAYVRLSRHRLRNCGSHLRARIRTERTSRHRHQAYDRGIQHQLGPGRRGHRLGLTRTPSRAIPTTRSRPAPVSATEESSVPVVTEGPERIRELIALGVPFSRSLDGDDYDLGLEGGHSHRRVLHAADHTGQEIVQSVGSIGPFDAEHRRLREPIRDRSADRREVRLAQGRARCWGAYVLDPPPARSRRSRLARRCSPPAARARSISTPPIRTSRPETASRWHVAQAAASQTWSSSSSTRRVSIIPGAKSFLVTEAMRGEGAVLRTPDGNAVHAAATTRARELAPRDIVARAIDQRDETQRLRQRLSRRHVARSRFPQEALPADLRALPGVRDRHHERRRFPSCRPRITCAAA